MDKRTEQVFREHLKRKGFTPLQIAHKIDALHSPTTTPHVDLIAPGYGLVYPGAAGYPGRPGERVPYVVPPGSYLHPELMFPITHLAAPIGPPVPYKSPLL